MRVPTYDLLNHMKEDLVNDHWHLFLLTVNVNIKSTTPRLLLHHK